MAKAKAKLGTWAETLETLNKLPKPPRRILLYGKPGTGKSTFATSIQKDYERVTLTPGMFPDALLGKFLLRDGSTVWTDAFASRAARRGCPLILDEINKAGAELDSVLQSILDDDKICVLNLDNGDAIKPEKGYRIIATMNGSPDELATPVLDRFDVVLRCDTPAPGLLKAMQPDAAEFIKNKMENEAELGNNWQPDISPRRMLAFCHLRTQGLEADMAAIISFGETQARTIMTALVDAARNAAAAERAARPKTGDLF